MKSFAQFIVYSNILISTGAGLLSSGVAFSFKITNYYSYFWFVFGATLFVYNAQRIFRLQELTGTLSKRHQWIIRQKKTVSLLSFTGLATALFWFIRDFIDIKSLIFITVFGVISVLYSFKLKPNLPALRELPFLKIHFVALTWTATCALFPVLHLPFFSDWHLIIAFYAYFIAITIPFDIRDLPYDKSFQKTIPQVLGKGKAIALAVALLLFSFIILFVYQHDLIFQPIFYVAYLYQLIFIIFSYEQRSEMFYSAGIDGGIILLGLSFY
jgi:4-hydroxybenzoate polyprenyltransferase